jgi:hypothetical protein
VDVELLRKLSKRSIALDGGKRQLRLKGRCVVPARSFAHCLSWFAGHSVPAVRQKLHLSPCADFRDHLSLNLFFGMIEAPFQAHSLTTLGSKKPGQVNCFLYYKITPKSE